MDIRRSTGESPWGWMKIHLALSPRRPEVSRLWVLSFEMRIGTAVVQVGGIAGVFTHKRHRRKGYSRLVMEEAARYFAETGHDLSLLFGLPGLYRRFGFAPVIPDTTVRVRTDDASASISELRSDESASRPVEDRDWSQLLTLYAHNHRCRTGSVVRSPGSWAGYRYGTEWNCATQTTVLAAGDELHGYVTFDDVSSRCRVADLAFATPSDFPALLAIITSRAERLRMESFELKLPPDHPFVEFCACCGSRVITQFDRNAGGMARIVDLHSLTRRLTGLLSERLRRGAWRGGEGVLRLGTESDHVFLSIGQGRVDLVDPSTPTWSLTLPQDLLVQLFFGYRSISEIALQRAVDVQDDATSLVEALFPRSLPWIAMPDRF